MDNDDKQLFALLDNYTVADADDALLERIVAQASATKTVAISARPAWFKSAAMVAATAVLGFWFGNATLQTATDTTSAQRADSGGSSVNLDKVILGPKTFSEVML